MGGESNSWLAQNLAALERVRPDVVAQLRTQTERIFSPPYRCEGDPPRDGVCVNSRGHQEPMYGDGLSWEERLCDYRQRWSVARFGEPGASPDHTLLVVGMGLGGHLAPLLESVDPEGCLIVFEPDPAVFLTTLMCVDLSDALADPRLRLLTGMTPERAVDIVGEEQGWGRFLHMPHRVLIHPPAQRLYPELCCEFTDRWNETIEREGAYLCSRIGNGEIVVYNTVGNLPRLFDSPGVAALCGRFADRPALLIGAGPSLTDQLETVRRAAEGMWIVCVNSAYPILRRAGIAPHFVLALDHEPRNWDSFHGQEHDPRTHLIVDPRVDPRIPGEFPDRTFLLSWHTTTESLGSPAPPNAIPLARGGGNSLYHWIQERLGAKGTISATGSVAVAAYQLLAFWGCRPILLLGLDFAFPGEKTYAEGTIFDDEKNPRDGQIAREVPSTSGDPVGTSLTLHLYRRLLEHEIQRFGCPTWNASLGGAQIAGTETMPLDAALERIGPREPPNPADLYALAEGEDALFEHRDRIATVLKVATDDLIALVGTAGQAVRRMPDETADLPPQAVEEAERELASLRTLHPTAHYLLNELLQKALVDFEKARWECLQVPAERRGPARVERCRRALMEIVRQAIHLHSLLSDIDHV